MTGWQMAKCYINPSYFLKKYLKQMNMTCNDITGPQAKILSQSLDL